MRRLPSALLAVVAVITAPALAGIHAEAYGVTAAGQLVEKVVLENERGMRLAYIDYGATLVAAEVADHHGKRTNIILSLPDLAAFERTRGRYGAIIGRYAGRIANARYTLDGKTVQLVPNSKGMAIHGDPQPYDKRIWRRQDFTDKESIGSIYRLHSPDGDQNFPGAMDITVTYRLLRKRDEFRIEYQATTTAPTVLNLTNHVYLNLAGAAANTLEDHRFQIDADRYLETDAVRIPTGALLDVAGTPFDFRRAASVSARRSPAAMTTPWCWPNRWALSPAWPPSPPPHAGWWSAPASHRCSYTPSTALTARRPAAKASATSATARLRLKRSTCRIVRTTPASRLPRCIRGRCFARRPASASATTE
jgi:aldose 1-epimerase